MWKKLFLFTTITWMATVTKASVMQCTWNGELCQNVISMDPVLTANDVITVAGKPANYVNTVTVNLYFNNFTLKYIPKNLFSVFKSLTSLTILYFGTATLTTDSFVNCLNLKTIIIQMGTITNIPEGFAQTCSNIESISLCNDNIETIHVNAFQGLGKLTGLELRNNKISCIPADLFQPTIYLQTIFLNGNKIAGLDSGTFRNLASLRTLQLISNSISYLPNLKLATSINDITIYLFQNPIKAVKPDFCTILNPRAASSSIYLKDGAYQDGIPCLVPGIVFNKVTKTDCANFNNVMATCYANYNTSMSDSFPCTPSSVCIPGATYTKIIDIFRSIYSQIDTFLKSM